MFSEYLTIPAEELNLRIKNLQIKLEQKGIDYAIILQNTDIIYFTGILLQGIVVIPSNKEATFLVRKNIQLAKATSKLKNITLVKSIKDIADFVKSNSVIGFELDVVPYSNIEYYKNLLSPTSIIDISEDIKNIRSIKSNIEIDYIKRASSQLYTLFDNLKNYIQPGLKEVDIFIKAEEILQKNGHQGFMRMRGFNQEMFFGHIISGKESLQNTYLDAPTSGKGLYPSFPQGSSTRVLQNNDILSVDLVGCFNGYHSDETRPFSLGKIDKDFEKGFKCMLQIHNEVVNFIKPGILPEEAYFKALDTAKKLGVEDSFMGSQHKVKFIGHGIGLEVDEPPFLAAGFKKPFAESMVFAVEPKIFIQNKGVIGIENTFIVTKNGCEKLTLSPDEIIAV